MTETKVEQAAEKKNDVDQAAQEPLPVGIELDLSAEVCAAIAKASEEIDHQLARVGALREDFKSKEAMLLAEVAAARKKQISLMDAAVKAVGGHTESQAWHINYSTGKMTRKA